MLMRQLLSGIFFLLTINLFAAEGTTPTPQDTAGVKLSLNDAVALVVQNNNLLKISNEGINLAKAQKRELQAAWYPFVSATGGHFILSNDIEAKANVGEIAQDLIPNLAGLEQIIPQLQGVVAGISNINLTVPLIENQITTLDASLIWPLITGGKRIYASRIGDEIEEIAKEVNRITYNATVAAMLNAYYTLKLAISVKEERQQALGFMQKVHSNALKLQQNGFLTKAEVLVTKVALDESLREFENSKEGIRVAQSTLNSILGTNVEVIPTGEFFTLGETPQLEHYREEIIANNGELKIVERQMEIAQNREKIAKSNYTPNFALFAKQTLYSHNVPDNLLPRGMVGVAMQWSIFDGFARESEIKKGEIEHTQLQYAKMELEDKLNMAATALHSQMRDALNNINTLQTTVSLAEELLREREKSFAEGMSTATDVVAAHTTLRKATTALNLAHWQYDTALIGLLALSSNTEEFIYLHNERKQ